MTQGHIGPHGKGAATWRRPFLSPARGDYWAADDSAGTHLPFTSTWPSGHSIEGAGLAGALEAASAGALEEASAGALEEARSAGALEEARSGTALDEAVVPSVVLDVVAAAALELGSTELLARRAADDVEDGSTDDEVTAAAGADDELSVAALALELAGAAEAEVEAGAEDTAADDGSLVAADDIDDAEALADDGALEALTLETPLLAELRLEPSPAEADELPDGSELSPAEALALAETSPEAEAEALPICCAAWSSSTACLGASSCLGGAICGANKFTVLLVTSLDCCGWLTIVGFTTVTCLLVTCWTKFTWMTLLTTMLFCTFTVPTNWVFWNASGWRSPKTTVALRRGSRNFGAGTKIQSGCGGSALVTFTLTWKPSCSGGSGAQPT